MGAMSGCEKGDSHRVKRLILSVGGLRPWLENPRISHASSVLWVSLPAIEKAEGSAPSARLGALTCAAPLLVCARGCGLEVVGRGYVVEGVGDRDFIGP